MLKNKTLIAPLGLVGITILSGVFLISSDSFATDNTDAVDEVNITVPISCSMEGTGMNSHNANIVNGTYQADIGSTTLKAFCNDTNGFAIYAIGYTDNEYGKTVLTNSALGSTYDIATGTATSGSTSNWAMKLATDGTATYAITLDNSFNAYHNVPTTYTKVAHRDSGTDIGTGATGAELTTTYAAFMSQTQPAGTYSGKVKYTLIHPSSETPLQPIACEAGKICYNANGSSVVGEMGKQSVKAKDWSSCNTYTDYSTICVVDGNQVGIDTLPELDSLVESATLYASNYKRDGYGFAGWNDEFDYSGNYYGPNETITVPSDVSVNGLSLYAVWIKSAGLIQNWNGCNSLAQGSTTALTDERDNNTYAVAKLADNKCWMIENLRLDNTPELSSVNTHNPSLPLNNSWYYNESRTTLSTSNHLSLATDPTQTAWCGDSSVNCDNQSMLSTNNTVYSIDNTALNYDAKSNVYGYGNYYNWYSATAGHGKYGSDYGSGYSALGDICPIGWHLPSGNNDGEFYSLNIAVNNGTIDSVASKMLRSYPNNYVYSGFVFVGSIINRNYSGGYFSSSGANNVNAYSLSFDNISVSPGLGDPSKRDGLVVRCVAGI